MIYDVDIAVIGAGPAGMAAAIRARWVKNDATQPADVLMIDPAGLGGIAAMGTIRLTGPAWQYDGPALAALLSADIKRLQIPLFVESAQQISPHGDRWEIETTGGVVTATSVVLATGLRRLSNEGFIRRAGRLTFLSGGYERARERFAQWCIEHLEAHLAIIGGRELADAEMMYAEIDRGRNTLHIIIEHDALVEGFALRDGKVSLKMKRGEAGELLVDHVMLDYHSLEVTPVSTVELPPGCRAEDGFIGIGPRGSAEFPGLFSAGDCAGLPSMCLKALAQGSEAGFHAYRHVMRRAGTEPDLFAFFPLEKRPVPVHGM